VGFGEIVVIMVIALVVLGPEKLPKLAADIGRWTGRARAMARQLRAQLDQEIHLEELRRATERMPAAPATPTTAATPATAAAAVAMDAVAGVTPAVTEPAAPTPGADAPQPDATTAASAAVATPPPAATPAAPGAASADVHS
jgi:sec-independent protein translocase protein TatB